MSRKQREKRAHAKNPAKTSTEQPAPEAIRANASINRLGLIVAVVGLAGLFGLVIFLGEGPAPAPVSESTEDDAEAEPEEQEEPPVERWKAAFLQEVPIDPDRDFTRGPADAAVNIVEFTDFECPFCTLAHTSLKKVVERYPSDVRLVYKNFPLDMA